MRNLLPSTVIDFKYQVRGILLCLQINVRTKTDKTRSIFAIKGCDAVINYLIKELYSFHFAIFKKVFQVKLIDKLLLLQICWQTLFLQLLR